jgi:hypothetical protein
MTKQLHIAVRGDADSDDERRAELTARLRSELQAHGIDADRPVTTAPDGAKGNSLEWAQLVVTLSGTLPVAVSAIRGWLGRHDDTQISVSIDGDEITVHNPTDEEQAELLRAWTERHGAD